MLRAMSNGDPFLPYQLPPFLLGFLWWQPQDLWAGFNVDIAPKSSRRVVSARFTVIPWHRCKVCLQAALKFFIGFKCDFLNCGLSLWHIPLGLECYTVT